MHVCALVCVLPGAVANVERQSSDTVQSVIIHMHRNACQCDDAKEDVLVLSIQATISDKEAATATLGAHSTKGHRNFFRRG